MELVSWEVLTMLTSKESKRLDESPLRRQLNHLWVRSLIIKRRKKSFVFPQDIRRELLGGCMDGGLDKLAL